jgi:soluble lytic murein transglycosylase-like protein
MNRNTTRYALIRRLWARVPVRARSLAVAQGAALALFTSVAVSVGSMETGYQRVEFAKPALVVRTSWDQEVDHFAARLVQALDVRPETAIEFAAWILEASARHKVEPELIASLIVTESHFRTDVQSHVGAVGPAQVRPEYWAKFCGTDLHDPEQNVYCGAQVYAYYKDRCGTDRCALAAYNTGLNSTQESAGRRYVAKVGDHLARFEVL